MEKDSGARSTHRRKTVRLQGHDYRESGSYFVTVCTEQRLRLFGKVSNGRMEPSHAGVMVTQVWNALAASFPGIALDAMVLMPDHVHGIITLGWSPESHESPALGDVVRYFKGRTTTRYFAAVREQAWHPVPGRLWQPRYFDRVVRNDRELEAIRAYIEANPQRWEERRRESG